MQKLKAIVFDLDGTLLKIGEYIPVFADLQYKALRVCNPKHDVKFSVKEMYEPLRLPWRESQQYLKEKWQVCPSAYWQNLFELDIKERKVALEKRIIAPFEDVHVIEDLKKDFKIGLLSNTPEEIVQLELGYYDLLYLFKNRVCAFYKCELSKPDTKGASELLKKLDVKPSEALMVGDSDVDVRVGKNAGMKTNKIDRGHYDYGGDEPDKIIHSLGELFAVS